MKKITNILRNIYDIILNLLHKKLLKEKTKELKHEFKILHIADVEDYLTTHNFSLQDKFYRYKIHNFYCKYIGGKVKLCIELESPGILIGKGWC